MRKAHSTRPEGPQGSDRRRPRRPKGLARADRAEGRHEDLGNYLATHYNTRIARGLTEIANDYGTDKGMTPGDRHGYTLIYELLLAPYSDLLFIAVSLG